MMTFRQIAFTIFIGGFKNVTIFYIVSFIKTHTCAHTIFHICPAFTVMKHPLARLDLQLWEQMSSRKSPAVLFLFMRQKSRPSCLLHIVCALFPIIYLHSKHSDFLFLYHAFWSVAAVMRGVSMLLEGILIHGELGDWLFWDALLEKNAISVLKIQPQLHFVIYMYCM